MIRRLLARLSRIDWTLPITVEPRGGGPALDRALDEDEVHIEASERGLTGRDRTDWIEQQLETGIRADQRRRVLAQENTANGQPPLRIGMYFRDGNVPH